MLISRLTQRSQKNSSKEELKEGLNQLLEELKRYTERENEGYKHDKEKLNRAIAVFANSYTTTKEHWAEIKNLSVLIDELRKNPTQRGEPESELEKIMKQEGLKPLIALTQQYQAMRYFIIENISNHLQIYASA